MKLSHSLSLVTIILRDRASVALSTVTILQNGRALSRSEMQTTVPYYLHIIPYLTYLPTIPRPRRADFEPFWQEMFRQRSDDKNSTPTCLNNYELYTSPYSTWTYTATTSLFFNLANIYETILVKFQAQLMLGSNLKEKS